MTSTPHHAAMAATADSDQTRWSTRYYRTDCPDVVFTMRTNGPDDRDDPPADTRLPCIVTGHSAHSLTRVSPFDDEEDLDV